ncbi:mitogen-activated protein kinase 15 isoform X11 [Peromyscus maniculatus bairdii]|uniref:mitogen-activated protein kinase 15 isoform X11 n=1 Tax=Peromyscus maniculatus bairdii TaxID=230844 RepID=UPI001C2E210C|nr:mitogen-activated protein kinase 15 isoform X7 [Peromyscus maniculatus bairdii]
MVHPWGGHVEPGLHIRRDASGAAPVSRHIDFPPAGADPGDHSVALHGGAPGPWLRLQCPDSAEPWVQTPPQKPWTSSSDSWRLLRTRGLALSRRCNTPTCRDSIARTASGRGDPTCGSRCTKGTSSLHRSIATACTRCRDSHCPLSTGTLEASYRSDLSAVRPPLSAPPIPQMILERRGNSRSPGEEGLGGAASRAELRVSPARVKPGVLPQVPAETPARKRGPRPQSSPGHNPEHVEVPRQSSDPLFQLPPPSRGERPPGATAEPPSAPSGVKTNLRVVAPSLTSQAAAQAANQALIRSDPARGGGPRAAGARRVSPALPSSLQCGSYPPEPCSTPLPPEQDPRLRAGPFPPAPGGPGTPTRPKDVWHLGLAGGPGRSQSCAWRLLPGLWDRVPLGAGPPAPAPRTACVSRPPAASSRQPGAVPQPPAHLPPLSICIRVPGGFSEPLSPKGE